MDYDDVVGLLMLSGCVEPNTLLEQISMLKITKSIHNGQVFVTCTEPGVCQDWVKKLNLLEGTSITKCHSYSDKEVTVRFSYIHPSINIQKEIVEKFLENYGDVKEWSALRDKKYGIPNGSYVFIMKEEDLAKKPLPESIFLNHMQCFISYRTQVVLCHNCGEEGHISKNCTKMYFPHLQSTQGKSGHGNSVFLGGVLPRRPLNRRAVEKHDVLQHLSKSQDQSGISKLNTDVVTDNNMSKMNNGSHGNSGESQLLQQADNAHKRPRVDEDDTDSDGGGMKAKIPAVEDVVLENDSESDSSAIPQVGKVVEVPMLSHENNDDDVVDKEDAEEIDDEEVDGEGIDDDGKSDGEEIDDEDIDDGNSDDEEIDDKEMEDEINGEDKQLMNSEGIVGDLVGGEQQHLLSPDLIPDG